MTEAKSATHLYSQQTTCKEKPVAAAIRDIDEALSFLDIVIGKLTTSLSSILSPIPDCATYLMKGEKSSCCDLEQVMIAQRKRLEILTNKITDITIHVEV